MMKTTVQAVTIVFSDRKNIVLALIAGGLFAAIFVFASGMITFFLEGPYIELQPLRLATLAALTLLSGLVVPMQWVAIGKARAGLKGSTSSFGGILIGLATMSCCTPLLLPALLAFVGFSGTQLLFFNSTLRQYVLPLSLVSVSLLFISLLMVSKSVVATCRLDVKKTL